MVPVAEDDGGEGAALGRGSQGDGSLVDRTADGAAALNHLRTYQSDVATIDWRMPEAHIAGLRARLEGRRARIETVRGSGYRPVAP